MHFKSLGIKLFSIFEGERATVITLSPASLASLTISSTSALLVRLKKSKAPITKVPFSSISAALYL